MQFKVTKYNINRSTEETTSLEAVSAIAALELFAPEMFEVGGHLYSNARAAGGIAFCHQAHLQTGITGRIGAFAEII